MKTAIKFILRLFGIRDPRWHPRKGDKLVHQGEIYYVAGAKHGMVWGTYTAPIKPANPFDYHLKTWRMVFANAQVPPMS